VAALAGVPQQGSRLAAELRKRLDAATARGRDGRRPRVYFEEWDEPMIAGIGWVSELIGIAGGDDVFPELARQKAAKDRIVSGDMVAAARPDIIIGSWCGKKFRPEHVAARHG